MDTQVLVRDFVRVAALAGANLRESDIRVEITKAPHHAPTRLPSGKIAVYVFSYGDTVLKVGKAGPNSGARYTSQHYNAASAPSTLAAALLKSGGDIGVSGLAIDSAGGWIKHNTDRTNFLLNIECGVPVLTLLEAFLQCRLKPRFEGFASQR